MPMDFYCMPRSAPCRSGMLTAKALGVELNLKKYELMAGEHLNPEFVAINPQHCIPTLVDGDHVLWESRVICSYLASQYGKDDSLYPKDPKVRSKVDFFMYFDMGTLYDRFAEYVYPVMFHGAKKTDPEKLEKLHEALGWLDGYLTGHDWAVGNQMTIADFVLVPTVSAIEAVDIDVAKYNNLAAWLARCKASMIGYAEVNQPGVDEFGKMGKAKLGAN